MSSRAPWSVLAAFAVALATLALTGCAHPQVKEPSMSNATASVKGTVTYLARIALPPTAVVKVQLVDVSRADVSAVVLGEQVIETKGRQVPFAFEIPYDPAKIEASHSYAVQARIEEGGQLRFINDQRYAVITRDAPTEVELVLKPVGGPASK